MSDRDGCDALGARMVQQVCNEFDDMPGLRLTLAQAQRLWGLDARSCRQLLDALVEAKFLDTSDHGLYRRINGGGGVEPAAAGLRVARRGGRS